VQWEDIGRNIAIEQQIYRSKPMTKLTAVSRTITAFAFFLVASNATADNAFYCGGKIISEGLSKQTVEEFCGPPAEKNSDYWTYDRGPGELRMVLNFGADGTINSIAEEDPEEG
jgi:hypothetical protein